jgi:hypothetical protein
LLLVAAETLWKSLRVLLIIIRKTIICNHFLDKQPNVWLNIEFAAQSLIVGKTFVQILNVELNLSMLVKLVKNSKISKKPKSADIA